MAEDSWPSPDHSDGAVNDAEYERLAAPGALSGLVGVPTDPALVYADSSGRLVKLRASRYAKVRGRTWYSGTSDLTLTIAANASGQPRIDLIVLRYSRTTYNVTAAVVQGTPAASPVAPATTNQTGSTGVWELPVARVSVANGVATLAANTVTPVGWYLADDGSVLCTATTRPAISLVGQGVQMTETDTGKIYFSVGSSWLLLTEDTGETNLTAASGWSANSTGLWYRKQNALVTATIAVNRTGAALPAAASNDSQITTMPSGSRPGRNVRIVGYINGAFLAVGYIQTSGAVLLTDYYQHGVAVGETVQFATVSYPVA